VGCFITWARRIAERDFDCLLFGTAIDPSFRYDSGWAIATPCCERLVADWFMPGLVVLLMIRRFDPAFDRRLTRPGLT
jgi:hypothetical protein